MASLTLSHVIVTAFNADEVVDASPSLTLETKVTGVESMHRKSVKMVS